MYYIQYTAGSSRLGILSILSLPAASVYSDLVSVACSSQVFQPVLCPSDCNCIVIALYLTTLYSGHNACSNGGKSRQLDDENYIFSSCIIKSNVWVVSHIWSDCWTGDMPASDKPPWHTHHTHGRWGTNACGHCLPCVKSDCKNISIFCFLCQYIMSFDIPIW